MTLSTLVSRVSYAGDGTTTVFPFPYYFLANADLVVIQKNNSTGVETTKVITTDYTVTGAGVSSGGSVTMLTAPPSGETLTIYRDPAQTQDLNLVENDPMPAEELEKRYDKLTMISQRISDLISRAQRFTDGYAGSFDPRFPTIITPSAFLQVKSDGTGWEFKTTAALGAISLPGGTGIAIYTGSNTFTNRSLVAGTGLTITNGDGVSGNPQVDFSSSLMTAYGTFNLGLSGTTALNALTIAMKDASGANASATSAVRIKFRNPTAATGTPVVGSVTGALSTTISSGSTAGHLSGVDSFLYIYALYNSGTVELAWSSSNQWDEGALQTTTAEGGAGAADSAVTLYSTTARSNVPIRLIGRFKSNQATAGTWASAILEIAFGPFETFGVPAGVILPYGGVISTVPVGYLACDGTSYLRTQFPRLFSAIGTAYGAADGTHFNVPDLRGIFMRFTDNGLGTDPDAASRTAIKTGGNTGNNVGSYQADEIIAHQHNERVPQNVAGAVYGMDAVAGFTQNPQNGPFSTGSTGGNETRPKNVYVNGIIKY